MDRARGGITKSQVGFFDIVALPLYKSLAQVTKPSAICAVTKQHGIIRGWRARNN